MSTFQESFDQERMYFVVPPANTTRIVVIHHRNPEQWYVSIEDIRAISSGGAGWAHRKQSSMSARSAEVALINAERLWEEERHKPPVERPNASG